MSVEAILLADKKYIELPKQCIYTFKAGTPTIPSYQFNVDSDYHYQPNKYSCSQMVIFFPDAYQDTGSQTTDFDQKYVFNGYTLTPGGTQYATFVSNNQTHFNVKVSDLEGILKYATITPLGGVNNHPIYNHFLEQEVA